jgi:large subunit ribosomal protein L35
MVSCGSRVLPHGAEGQPKQDREQDNEDMPKQKTHKGTAKRVRVTGTGKLMREQANNQHKFEHKSSTRKRRLDQDQVLSPADTKNIKKLLGI